MTKIVDSKSIDLDELFNNVLLMIPAYQRPYSWEKKQVKELWQDIIQCSANKDEQHFLGPLYFKLRSINTDAWLEVTDGQQRITSVFLFLLAFRRVLTNDFRHESLHQDSSYMFIQHKIETMIVKNGVSRLHLGASDRFAFNLIFSNFATIPDDESKFKLLFSDNETYLTSASLLHNNFIFFYKELKKILQHDWEHSQEFLVDKRTTNANPEYLHFRKKELIEFRKILDTLTDRFSLIKCLITVEDESRVFKLFETINDRGKPLDQVDKIKNFLFMNVYDYFKSYNPSQLDTVFQEVQNKWADIQSTLDSHVEDYIRYYLISKDKLNKHIRKKDLYYDVVDFFDQKMIENYSDFLYEGKFSDLSTRTLLSSLGIESVEDVLDMDVDLDEVTKMAVKAYESFEIVSELAKNCRSYLQIVDPARCDYIKNTVIRANLKYSLNYTLLRLLLLRLIMDYSHLNDNSNMDRLRSLIVVTTNAALTYIGVMGFSKQDAVEEELYKNFFKDDKYKNFFEDCDDFSDVLKGALEKVAPAFTDDQDAIENYIINSSNDHVAFLMQCKLNDYIANANGSGDYFYPKILIEKIEPYSLNKDHILPQSPNADYWMHIESFYLENNLEIPTKQKLTKDVIKRVGNIIPIHRETNLRAGNGQHLPIFNTINPKGYLLQSLVDNYPINEPWLPNHVERRTREIANLIVQYGVLSINEDEALF
jgi:uncharacterized protein with ParB-like and HNH nuclease domain